MARNRSPAGTVVFRAWSPSAVKRQFPPRKWARLVCAGPTILKPPRLASLPFGQLATFDGSPFRIGFENRIVNRLFWGRSEPLLHPKNPQFRRRPQQPFLPVEPRQRLTSTTAYRRFTRAIKCLNYHVRQTFSEQGPVLFIKSLLSRPFRIFPLPGTFPEDIAR